MNKTERLKLCEEKEEELDEHLKELEDEIASLNGKTKILRKKNGKKKEDAECGTG